MLQFIFGRPASGKTYTVLQKIKELTQKGEESVLIVPEQFTNESERAVLNAVGDKFALYVKIVSFTRLYDEIGRKIGGISATVLREADKIIFMNKTLNAVGDDLKLWGKYRNSVTFAKSVLDTIGEFKINSVSAEDLRAAAKRVGSETLKYKLDDLSLIYENYDAMLGERFLDPADMLTYVYEKLKQFNYFENKTVFLDSFKGFTGQQYTIIKQIFSQAKDVYISFTEDPEIKGDYCVYANIRKAVSKIKADAKSRGIKELPPIVLNNSYYENNTLSAVERLLAGGEKPKEITGKGVYICKAQSMYDEAEFVATTIRRLVRTENYRYRDFVIIARDSEKYQSSVESACKKNGINCFIDSKIPLCAFPICVAGSCAIEALKFSTEAILNFHKTGLGTLAEAQISALENYCYIWNIDGSLWEKPWDMDPRGMTNYEDKNGEAAKELEELNRLREIAIEPILKFKREFGNTALSMCRALMNLFDFCHSTERLKELTRKYKNINNTFYADAIKQSYDEYLNILDSLVVCFGEASIIKKDFLSALNLALSLGEIGVIPQTLDEVSFGAADRIRPSRPKIAFILGANQGEFPKTVSKHGVFALSERKELILNEISIPDNGVESSINENFLVYSNACCPTNGLYICYNSGSLSGEERKESVFVEQIRENIPCEVLSFPNSSQILLPETKAGAFSEYCRLLKRNQIMATAIKESLENSELEGAIFGIGEGRVKRQESISPKTAKELYGESISMSASKLDVYNRCHFSFFCKFGLKAEKIKPADFNNLQRGTIVHYCLERLITDRKNEISALSYDELDTLCDQYVEEYLNSVTGFLTVLDAKLRFIIGRIARQVKEVFHSICDEMKQSDFVPKCCEMEISNIKFPYDGGEISLRGSVDRVDEYEGYIRIIDYKTGTKSFKLPDILVGLNLQMLIYLYSIVRGGKIEDSKPGGILYKPSKRDLNGKGLAMNGLIPEDEALLKAMDKEMQGEFVPKAGDKKSFIDYEDFEEIFDHIERLMLKTGNEISSGDIRVSPIDGLESSACEYCEFSAICGIEDEAVPKVSAMNNRDVINTIKEEKNGD